MFPTVPTFEARYLPTRMTSILDRGKGAWNAFRGSGWRSARAADSGIPKDRRCHNTRSQPRPVSSLLGTARMTLCHCAAILPGSMRVVKPQRPAGRGLRTPWLAGQTTAGAGGPATSRRERDGGRWVIVSRLRQSDRGLWALAYSREPEMREDPVNDTGARSCPQRPQAPLNRFIIARASSIACCLTCGWSSPAEARLLRGPFKGSATIRSPPPADPP